MKKLMIAIACMFSVSLMFANNGDGYDYHDDYKVVDKTCNTVIATNGLNIRKAPDTKSEVVGYAPFGAKVEILSETHFGWDVIGEHTFYTGVGSSDEYSWTEPVEGFWVEVEYEGTIGYMFSAYLYYGNEYLDYENEFQNSVNQDFAILYPHFNCADNVVNVPGMIWYGVYQVGDKISLRQVEINYFHDYDEISSLAVTTKDNEGLMFIIGSKEHLPPGQVFGHTFDKWEESIFYADYYYEELNEDLMDNFSLNIENFEKEDYIHRELTLNTGGRSQALNPEGYDLGDPMNLEFIGDLDGDGQQDYIIVYGEEFSQTVLYLSSKAEEGQTVKPVAVYYSGFCC